MDAQWSGGCGRQGGGRHRAQMRGTLCMLAVQGGGKVALCLLAGAGLWRVRPLPSAADLAGMPGSVRAPATGVGAGLEAWWHGAGLVGLAVVLADQAGRGSRHSNAPIWHPPRCWELGCVQ